MGGKENSRGMSRKGGEEEEERKKKKIEIRTLENGKIW